MFLGGGKGGGGPWGGWAEFYFETRRGRLAGPPEEHMTLDPGGCEFEPHVVGRGYKKEK